MLSYLAYICPEGDGHEYKNNKCIKCLLPESISDIYSKEISDYINKYNDFYNSHTSPAINNYKKNKEITSEKIEWKYNESSLLEIVDKTNISYNLLKSIGATELVDRDKLIINGERLPYPDNPYDQQIQAVFEYIQILLSEYNRLRNITKVSNENVYLNFSNIISENKLTDDKLFKISEILPEIKTDYIKIAREFQKQNMSNPTDIYLFVSNMLFDIIISMTTNPIGISYVYVFLEKLVSNELSFTKHKEYDKTLFLRPKWDTHNEDDIVDMDVNVDSGLAPKDDGIGD
jgi:hypothetical protein